MEAKVDQLVDGQVKSYTNDTDKKTFVVTECPIESVVVYRDRAELCRSLKCKLLPGEKEIIVKDLSKYVDPDSIRVEVKSAGNDDKNVQERSPVTIMEVAFQENTVEKVDKSEEARMLDEKLKTLSDSLRLLEKKESRLNQQIKYLTGAGDTVQSGKQNTSEKEGRSFIQDLDEFLKFYDTCATKLDEDCLSVNREIETLKQEKSKVIEDIKKQNLKKQDPISRDISILLDLKKMCEVELRYSYVVTQASWSPKYDIRVFSNDKIMKLQYQGMICQNTGEDWQDAKISLSTAMPSVGGRPPVIGVMQLYFRDGSRPATYTNKFMNVARKSFTAKKKGHQERQSKWQMPMPMQQQQIFGNIANEEEQQQTNMICDQQFYSRGVRSEDEFSHTSSLSEDEGELTLEEEYGVGETSVTEVKESVTNATFEIPRRSTIPSDNTSHKVAIAFIDLQPTFKYQSGGVKSKHCFLTAKVKNTSAYTLLAGPGNVFLDNNFISKTSLRGVSPSEVFECYLGVDPAVKVIFNSVGKYREQSGTFFKSVTITYCRTIIVKNTRTIPVKVMVTDFLPQSTEDRIKVTLLEPVIKSGKTEGVHLNSKKNIEWDMEILAGKSEELVVKYTVEHPTKEKLAFKLVE